MDLIKAQRLAEGLISVHAPDWSFGWDRSRKRFGAAHFLKKTTKNGRPLSIPVKRITLSRYLTELNDETQVRDVILHELAHVKAGAKAGHSRLWKAHARALGARPERCHSAVTATEHAPWVGICRSCGIRNEQFRLTRDMHDHGICTSCVRRTRRRSPDFRFDWTWQGQGEPKFMKPRQRKPRRRTFA
jgi:predicted SprT family Zn-dependent metalloprotease